MRRNMRCAWWWHSDEMCFERCPCDSCHYSNCTLKCRFYSPISTIAWDNKLHQLHLRQYMCQGESMVRIANNRKVQDTKNSRLMMYVRLSLTSVKKTLNIRRRNWESYYPGLGATCNWKTEVKLYWYVADFQHMLVHVFVLFLFYYYFMLITDLLIYCWQCNTALQLPLPKYEDSIFGAWPKVHWVNRKIPINFSGNWSGSWPLILP